MSKVVTDREVMEVIEGLLYQSGPITKETPCRCGATQPAHYCPYRDKVRHRAETIMIAMACPHCEGTGTQ